MIRTLSAIIPFVVLVSLAAPAGAPQAQKKSPGAGPIIVLETAKGVIEFETYPEEAPKTVAQIVGLVKKGFYNGLRFHRVEPKFVAQIGDPQTRNMTLQEWWGRNGSGKPIGAAEISKKRRHLRGAVGMGHSGDPRMADSQFYILMGNRPGLDGKYTVFGRVLSGMDVVDRIAAVPTQSENPIEPVTIKGVTIKTP
jgi:peptidyl-prolyl cis-trans isomerase B (cyclophilin B)